MFRRISKYLIIFVCVISFFLPLTALAQPVPTLDSGQFTFLREKQSAPFDGYLFDSAGLIKLQVQTEFELRRAKLDWEYASQRTAATAQLQLDSCKISLDALRETSTEITNLKDKEIDRLQNVIIKSSDNNNVWWLVGGFSGGVILTTAIVLTVIYVQK